MQFSILNSQFLELNEEIPASVASVRDLFNRLSGDFKEEDCYGNTVVS
jgi:hypothetical protein